MIFVTVGTHEQQFNRLIKYIDEMEIDEKVIIQKGFSDYEPLHCETKRIMPYEMVNAYVKEARIVITHGGPSSIMMPLQIGKIPIVVPRQKKYGEHVNDHQLEFVEKISRNGNIIPIFEIQELENVILNYDKLVSVGAKLHSNNYEFNRKLEKTVEELFRK